MNRSAVPTSLKRIGRTASRVIGRASHGLRMSPEFLVIGCNRCGTTALHRALIAHPLIVPPNFHKGVGYFDLNYHRGEEWYRAHFPIEALTRRRSSSLGIAPLAMETSNYYFDHPLAASRIANDKPDAKLIAILRDPVERAHSAYRHNVKRGMESETFERALELEAERTEGEEERIVANVPYESYAHRSQSYLRRGQYIDRLEAFAELFPADQIHVVFSEEFERFPEREYVRMLDFLGLPDMTPADGFPRHNASPGADLKPETRDFLAHHYAPYDDRLENFLGRDLPWRSQDASDA